MPEVTLTFKCGVISSEGQIDPDSYKFFTWSFITGEEGSEGPIGHVPLAQRILGLYPDIPDDTPYRIVYIGIPLFNLIKEILKSVNLLRRGQ